MAFELKITATSPAELHDHIKGLAAYFGEASKEVIAAATVEQSDRVETTIAPAPTKQNPDKPKVEQKVSKPEPKKEFVEDAQFSKPAEEKPAKEIGSVWNEEEQAELEAAEANAKKAAAAPAKAYTRQDLQKLFADSVAKNPNLIKKVKEYLKENFGVETASNLNDEQRNQLGPWLEKLAKGE